MDDKTRRIVKVAMELAERDGYDAVRLRDLAKRANVALGTVYRRFESKEDILFACLELEFERLKKQIAKGLPADGDVESRITAAFASDIAVCCNGKVCS